MVCHLFAGVSSYLFKGAKAGFVYFLYRQSSTCFHFNYDRFRCLYSRKIAGTQVPGSKFKDPGDFF